MSLRCRPTCSARSRRIRGTTTEPETSRKLSSAFVTTSFSSSRSFLLTSESVTEGHPDKVCDQVSDAVLDGMLAQDLHARVACETAITKGLCVVIGEVTTHAELDIQRTIRDTIRSIGYNDEQIGFDADHALIQVYLKEQSADIAAGVNHSLEEREGLKDEDPFELQGAGDQGMMIGFACRETPELMPLTISLANRLAKKLAQTRKNGSLPFLRPDGQIQVTVEYEHGQPKRNVAKNLVAAGLADRCEVQVSYAIGRAHPTSIAVETFGTGTKSEEELLNLVRRHFDLRPGAIIANMDLLRPIYRPTAAYGHFGRDDLGVPWEMTNKVDALRADATVAARQS